MMSFVWILWISRECNWVSMSWKKDFFIVNHWGRTSIRQFRTLERERANDLLVSRETYSRDQCSDKSHLSIYMRMQITDRERERERERDVPPLSLSIVLIKNFITKKEASTATSIVCIMHEWRARSTPWDLHSQKILISVRRMSSTARAL